MEKGKTTMTAGTWEKLTTAEMPESQALKFDVNIPREVVFVENEPTELASEGGGVYYMFLCQENGKDAVLNTSAWTLLRELKKIAPLKGKKVKIVKKLVKGKQGFEVSIIA